MPTVNISVSAPGIINVSPDPIPVSGANATITFNLLTSGYHFPSSNAVVVPQPGSQFPNPATTVSPTSATLFDANTDANSYKYVVHLVRTSDNQPLNLDPIIENGQ